MAHQKEQHLFSVFSESRLAPYLEEANGVYKNALKLYRWNLKMSSAFHTLLASTEILLRNAIDRELQTWNKAQPGYGPEWLTKAASPLGSLVGGEATRALNKAKEACKLRTHEHPRHGERIDHNDILAQVSFSLWRDLMPNFAPNAADNSSNRGRSLLWTQALSNCFPRETDNGKATYWRVVHLYRLRNRVSHMESLLKVDLKARMRDLEDILQGIDPPAANWILAEKKVALDLIAKREDF